MSNDLNQLLERRNKLEQEPNHKISADYSELMKTPLTLTNKLGN